MAGTFKKSTDISAEPEERKGISGSTVKIIAVLAMLIDHIAAVVLMCQIMKNGYMNAVLGGESGLAAWTEANRLLYSAYEIMRMAGRIGFPIFCFLLVEGFQKTRDVKKYGLRLGIFALLSEVPFDLAISGIPFSSGYQNVYFTLFLGLFALCAHRFFEQCRQPDKMEMLPGIVWKIFIAAGVLFPGIYFGVWLGIWFIPGSGGQIQDYLTLKRAFPGSFILLCVILCIAAVVWFVLYGRKKGMSRLSVLGGDITVLILIMYLADLLRTDYGGMGVLTIMAMYLFRKSRVKSMAAGCVVLTIMSASELCAFFALIPVALYNGKRGLKMKYFFYAFYPVHLLLLYLVTVWMGLRSPLF